jgi:hypothetical protein
MLVGSATEAAQGFALRPQPGQSAAGRLQPPPLLDGQFRCAKQGAELTVGFGSGDAHPAYIVNAVDPDTVRNSTARMRQYVPIGSGVMDFKAIADAVPRLRRMFTPKPASDYDGKLFISTGFCGAQAAFSA